MRYSKRIVILVITLNVIFTAACFFMSYSGSEVPDTLIEAWFMFTGSELLALAGIKITETIKMSDILSIKDKPNASDMED